MRIGVWLFTCVCFLGLGVSTSAVAQPSAPETKPEQGSKSTVESAAEGPPEAHSALERGAVPQKASPAATTPNVTPQALTSSSQGGATEAPSNCNPSKKAKAPPLRVLDKRWFLAGLKSVIAPSDNRNLGAVLELVPTVSNSAVWFGIQLDGAYNFRENHEKWGSLGLELGYAWIALLSGALLDADRSGTRGGWRNSISLIIPFKELGSSDAEVSRSACCAHPDTIWENAGEMKCLCDRNIQELVLRPYFQLDYQRKANLNERPEKWHLYPTFGLSLSYAYGW